MHDLTIVKNPQLKPHGFSGQRMAVVPSLIWHQLEAHSLLKGLLVTDAGFFPKAKRHFISRPSGIAAHVVIICVEGKGQVLTGNRTHPVQTGDLVWLPADEAHRYSANFEDPWSILWVHFVGEESSGWRALLFGNAGETICRIPSGRIGELAFDRIHSILEHGHSLLNLVEAATALRHSLGVVARLREWPGSTLSARSRIAASVKKLRDDSALVHRLDELAIQSGVSVSHYVTLFKKETGFSPIDFVIRQRIQNATRLLMTSGDSISSIAGSIGFEDPYYFSRTFRKIMGCSPRAYRHRHHTKERL